MKKLQRFLSAVLCILMIAAMAIPAAASAAPTASKLSVNDILKDFDKDDYTVVEFGKGGKISLAEYAGGSGILAEHTVYEGVNATKLVAQDIGWASFAKSHIAFGNNVSAFKEYGYMVVKYASESDKAYSLIVGGWGGSSDGVTMAVPAGKTGWTTSEVLTISAECVAVSTTKRSVTSSSSTADTYIGDIVFFKNKADAEEYAKWAPIYLDPNGDATLRRIQKREENWETIKLIMMLVGSAVAERMELKPEPKIKPLDGIDEGTYYIFDCTSVTRQDYLAQGNPAGEITTYNDIKAVKLGVQQINWAQNARSNVTYHRDNFIHDDMIYMVMRYASESDRAYSLGIGWGNYYDGASFTVAPGNTGWTLSPILTVSDALVTGGANNRAIASTSATADTYVADIVFFKNRADAKLYIKQWNEYHEGKLNPDVSSDPVYNYNDFQQYRITADNYGSAVGQHSNWNANIAFNYTSTYGIAYSTNPAVDYSMSNASFVVANAIDPAVWTTGNATNVSRVVLGGATDPGVDVAKYMVINYYSYCNADHQLGITSRSALGWKSAELAKVPAGQSGWHATEPLDLVATENAIFNGSDVTPDYINNLITGEMFIFSTGKEVYATKSSLKIASIVFFANEADAKAYAKEAPDYYNNLESDDLLTEIDSESEGDVYSTTFEKLDVNYEVTACGNWATFDDGSPTYGNAEYRGLSCLKIEPGTKRYAPPGQNPWSEESSMCYVSYRDMARSHADIFTGSTQYKYVVVTYASDTKSAAYLKMTTWGTPAKAVLSNDISISEGKWVTSDIIEIEGAWAQSNGARKMHIYSNLKTLGDKIYIRSINYFTDKADAERYVKEAPAYYNGEEYTNPLYWLSVLGKGDIHIQSFAEDGYAYANAGEYTTHANTTYGANNTPCLKLEAGNKVGHNAGKGGFISYTSVPTPHNTLLGGNAYPYAVVTYAYDNTSASNPVQLLLHPWYGSAPLIVVSEDMNISNGKWVTSGVIEENVKDWGSGTTAKKMQITTNDDSHNPYYIRSIVYFSNKDDAEAYIKAAPEYYNGEPNYDPDYWQSVLGEGEMLTQTFTKGNYTEATENTTILNQEGNYKGVDCAEVGYRAVSFPNSSSTYVFAVHGDTTFKNAINATEYKYAVMTYATETKVSAPLTAMHWRFVKDETTGAQVEDKSLTAETQLAADISVSNGKWVTSDIVEVGPNWRWRAGGSKIVYYSTSTDTDNPLYIREIRFFTNEDDAKLYQSLAPMYYNKHYGK